jgi:CTP:molybdopterin cytidylyltransferase MocA
LKTAVVLAAAGRSSRMNAFKPLLEICGRSLIDTVLDNFSYAGIRECYVTIGRNAVEMRAHLKSRAVLTENEDFLNTDMFHSIRLSLKKLDDCDAFFVLPADIAFVRPTTICFLRDALQELPEDVEALVPTLDGTYAHPLLFRRCALKKLLNFQSEGGLRGALETLSYRLIPVEDPGSNMDCDTIQDFETASQYAKKTSGISTFEIQRLWKDMDVPDERIRHMKEVTSTALTISERLIEKGYPIDKYLVQSGGLLHDIAKGKPHHSAYGEDYLTKLGYDAVAKVVGAHMRFLTFSVSESSVVYVADKLTKKEKHVTLSNRFKLSFEKHSDEPEVLNDVKASFKNSKQLLRLIGMEKEI